MADRWLKYVLTAALVVGMLALTAFMIEPWADYRHFASAIYPGDPSLIAWTLAWDSHALLTRTPLFMANVFHPASQSLAYNEHLLGVGLFALPIYALTSNPVLTHNLLWFAGYLLNALAFYALARHLALPRLAAVLGATIYAFSCFRMLHFAHVQYQWTFWIPLVIIAIDRWFRDGRPRMLAAIGLCVLLQMLVSGYMAVLLVLVVALYAVWTAGWQMRRSADIGVPLRRLGLLAAAGAFAAAAVWPVYAPYARLDPPDRREVIRNSATLESYYHPAEATLAGHIARRWGMHGGGIFGENTVYIGLAALVLTLIGVGAGLRSPTVWFFAGLGVLALALSLGPSTVRSGWRPFDLVASIGSMSLIRAPARFALLVVLAVSVLASMGAALIAIRFGRIGQPVLLILFALMIVEYRPLNPEIGKPQPVEVPRLYKMLATLPPGAVVSLPTFRGTPLWWREPDYLLFSTAHWRPIVNGSGRAEPPDYGWIIGHMRAFPGTNSAKTMRRLGIRYVMLHLDRFWDRAEADSIMEVLRTSPDFTAIAQDGQLYLVEVNGAN